MNNNDFILELKLQNENPELQQIFSNNVLCSQNMLNKYRAHFADFTDHTVLHSLEVIAFCNELVGENIDKLNADEIFVLLMSAYLHDSGMGITESDYYEFVPKIPAVAKYIEENPNENISKVIRIFHHDFSGKYIEKYSFLFDFPSKEHLFAVIQISRGHRKTNLFDENEYPKELKLNNGNIIHLPYLTALIRMADELDIAIDRNIQFLYDISDRMNTKSYSEFKKHQAIKKVEFEENALKVTVDFSDNAIKDGLEKLFVKLRKTLDECVDVIHKQTPFIVKHTELIIEKI